MATEPVTTSSHYDPSLAYTPPVGRLPILGKARAEIDRLRASAANDLNTIVVRNAAQVDSNAKITAEIASLQTTTADNTRKIDSEITAQTARTLNETNKINAEVDGLIAQTANEIVKTANDTTRTENDTLKIANDTARTENDTNRTIGELAALSSKTDAEVNLLTQKRDTERAQVSDTTVLGGTVAGIMGAQKALFEKQTQGFQRDAEQKLAKIMIDTWSVRQTTGGALPDPAGLDDQEIRTVLDVARAGISAGTATG